MSSSSRRLSTTDSTRRRRLTGPASGSTVSLVRLEEGLWERAEQLERMGYQVTRDDDTFGFGGGQVVVVDGEALIGGSDRERPLRCRPLSEASVTTSGTLSALLTQAVEKENVALVSPEDGQAITFAALERAVLQLAGRLSAVGVERGDRVALALPNGPEFVQILLAIDDAGRRGGAAQPRLHGRRVPLLSRRSAASRSCSSRRARSQAAQAGGRARPRSWTSSTRRNSRPGSR